MKSAREFARSLEALAAGRGDAVVATETALRCFEVETADDSAVAEVVGLSVWLLLQLRGRGHSCVLLEEWAGRVPLVGAVAEPPAAHATLPDLEEWESALDRSSLVGRNETGEGSSLLVLDGRGRLYLRRDLVAENRLAFLLAERLREAAPAPAEGESATEIDRVVTAARRGGLTVITGGPGTGKTTAVRTVLRALVREDPALRVALAAPTGKAAARLAEALDPTEAVPVRTLHRLLALHPLYVDADPPLLPYDLVVVDEASMVDLHLMFELLRRLEPTARLILVGDAQQLASVDAGSVLADLRRAAMSEGTPPPLRASMVELRRNWRFEDQPGISALAEAIRDGEADQAVEVLCSGTPDLVHHSTEEGMRRLCDRAVAAWQAAVGGGDLRDAARLLRETRVLCALREGPVGVGGLTRRIERSLRKVGARVDDLAYVGQPLLITENSPETDLANGDVGMVWEVEGRLVGAFESGDGGLRSIPVSQLPAHVDAWAMTIHKSQGSEFDEVWLVLPPESHPLATRDLVYTGVTRARGRLHLVGTEEALRECILREDPRRSGLSERLVEALR